MVWQSDADFAGHSGVAGSSKDDPASVQSGCGGGGQEGPAAQFPPVTVTGTVPSSFSSSFAAPIFRVSTGMGGGISAVVVPRAPGTSPATCKAPKEERHPAAVVILASAVGSGAVTPRRGGLVRVDLSDGSYDVWQFDCRGRACVGNGSIRPTPEVPCVDPSP